MPGGGVVGWLSLAVVRVGVNLQRRAHCLPHPPHTGIRHTLPASESLN